MSAASNYLELEVLDHVLGEGARNFTSPSALHVALFAGTASTVLTALESGTNSTSGSGNWGHYEITTGSYARQAVNFAAASSGSAASNSTVTFPVASANYNNAATSGATVTCIAVVDACSSGHVLFFGQLTTSKTVSSGDQFTVSSGNLTVSLA
jgi:hypothetical protein